MRTGNRGNRAVGAVSRPDHRRPADLRRADEPQARRRRAGRPRPRALKSEERPTRWGSGGPATTRRWGRSLPGRSSSVAQEMSRVAAWLPYATVPSIDPQPDAAAFGVMSVGAGRGAECRLQSMEPRPRILIAEDNYPRGGRRLRTSSAAAVTPSPAPAPLGRDGLALIAGDAVDGAVLDIDLGGTPLFPDAPGAHRQGVPSRSFP